MQADGTECAVGFYYDGNSAVFGGISVDRAVIEWEDSGQAALGATDEADGRLQLANPAGEIVCTGAVVRQEEYVCLQIRIALPNLPLGRFFDVAAEEDGSAGVFEQQDFGEIVIRQCGILQGVCVRPQTSEPDCAQGVRQFEGRMQKSLAFENTFYSGCRPRTLCPLEQSRIGVNGFDLNGGEDFGQAVVMV